jgi:MFS family permease
MSIVGSSATAERSAVGHASLFRDANFRWLFASGLVSMTGDQFTLIALPWLMLRLSSDPSVLGTALVLSSLPRILVLPIVGPFVDRYGGLPVLFYSKCLNCVLLLLLAAVASFGSAPLWAIYILVFGIGVGSSFGFPCTTALFPRAVRRERLFDANRIMMVVSQLAVLVGPVAAGIVVQALSGTDSAGMVSMKGLVYAFAVDGLSFLVSALAIRQVRIAAGPDPSPTHGSLARTKQALAHLWKDRDLRTCCLYWSACALVSSGPLQLGLPLLAQRQLAYGSVSLGTMLAAHGAGNLMGMVFAGPGSRRSSLSLGSSLLLLDFLIAVCLLPLGLSNATWMAAALLFMIGCLGGIMQTKIFTWCQLRTPTDMLGVATSTFMIMMTASAALSTFVTGLSLDVLSLQGLFFVASGGLCAIVFYTLFFSRFNLISEASAAIPMPHSSDR